MISVKAAYISPLWPGRFYHRWESHRRFITVRLTAHAAGYLGSIVLPAPAIAEFTTRVLPSPVSDMELALETSMVEVSFKASLEACQAARGQATGQDWTITSLPLL